MQITIAGMDLWIFIKNHQIFKNSPSVLRNRCLRSKKQIRTAAPLFEIGFGHGWANFNTQSVQPLSFSHVVASRSSGNQDSWHAFSECHEKTSDFVKLLIDLSKNVPPEENIRSAQQRLILKWVCGMGGPISTLNLCKH